MENGKSINQVIQEAIKDINFEEVAKEAAVSKIRETVKDAVSNQLKSYSGFGEKLQAQIKSELGVDVSRIKLPEYREFLIGAVNNALAAYTTTEHAKEITKYINEKVVGESRDEITFPKFWDELCEMIKDDCNDEDNERYCVELKRSESSWNGSRTYWDLSIATNADRASKKNVVVSAHFSDGEIYSTSSTDRFELAGVATWLKALQFRKTKVTEPREESTWVPNRDY